MKNKLIQVLFVCTFALQCNGQEITKISSDHVRIELIGPHDKPFGPLVITAIKLKLDIIEREILVNRNVLDSVTNFFSKNIDVTKERGVNEFGTFRVTTVKEGKKAIYYFPTRLKSIDIFKALREKVFGLETSYELVKQIGAALFYIGVRE
jgi:hypothetical protein